MVVGNKFPTISHPLSRLGSNESLSISGRSGAKSVTRSTRSVFLQPTPDRPRSESVACGTVLLKPEIPPKGSITPRCVTSQGRERIRTDEVIFILEEKLKHNNIPFVKKLFRSNDPYSEGIVTKEAFSRIVRQLCGYLTSRQFNNVVKRMNLERKSSIKIEDLLDYFGEPYYNDKHNTRLAKEAQWLTSPNSTTDQILTPNSMATYRGQIIRNNKTHVADQAWNFLKEKAVSGELDLTYLFPPMCFGEGAYVIPGQLRECLQKLHFEADDEIVSKIFRKILGGSPFAVHTCKLLYLLGLDKNGIPIKEKTLTPVISDASRKSTMVSKPPRPKTVASLLNGKIENENRTVSAGSDIVQPLMSVDVYIAGTFNGDVADMVAKKLEEGQAQLIKAIKAKDPSSSGFITKPDLKDVLNCLEIPVKATNLEHFFVRNGLRCKDGLLNYRVLLQRLQSRSSIGLLNKVVRNKDHVFHDDEHPQTPQDGVTAPILEIKLLHMFQREFLSLLSAFRQYDQQGTGFLNTDEFKSAIENHFGIKIIDSSWNVFLSTSVKCIPPPSNASENKGYISYNDFLAKYDVMLRPATAHADDPWVKMEKDLSHLSEHKDRYIESMKVDPADHTHSHEPRPLDQLEVTLVDVFLYKFHQFMKEYDLCVREDYRRVDKEKFDYILFRCGFVLTPSELSRLWLSMPVTRPMESLSIPTILQHVMRLYYANVKPGKFNKMSRDSAMVTEVLEKIRVSILTNWNMLKKKFRFLDRMGTSRILKEDMISIMKGLKPDINDMELHYLIEMLESRISGKTNYFRLMEYFSKNPKKSSQERSPIHSSESNRIRQSHRNSEKVPKTRQHNYVHVAPPTPQFINLQNAPYISPFKRITVQKSLPQPYIKQEPTKTTEFAKRQSKSKRYDFREYRGNFNELVRHTRSPVVSGNSAAHASINKYANLNLNRKDLPALGRALRKEDRADSGKIPVDAFRKILGYYGVDFNDPNQLYRFLSCYDLKMRDQVSYENFLQAIA